MIVDEKYLLDKQKEEIEYLAEDNKRLNELVASGTEVMDYWNDKYLEERAKNGNLQRQVNDLIEQRDVFKRLFESANTSNFSTDSIIETMNSFYREQAEHLAGLKIEQAVKDMAKKIWQELYNETIRCGIPAVYCTLTPKEIKDRAKRYGVEVE